MEEQSNKKNKVLEDFKLDYFIPIGRLIGLYGFISSMRIFYFFFYSGLETILCAVYYFRDALSNGEELATELSDLWMLMTVSYYVASKVCESNCRPRDITNSVGYFRWVIYVTEGSFEDELLASKIDQFSALGMREYWCERDLLIASELTLLRELGFRTPRKTREMLSVMLNCCISVFNWSPDNNSKVNFPHLLSGPRSSFSLISNVRMPPGLQLFVQFSSFLLKEFIFLGSWEEVKQSHPAAVGLACASEACLHLIKWGNEQRRFSGGNLLLKHESQKKRKIDEQEDLHNTYVLESKLSPIQRKILDLLPQFSSEIKLQIEAIEDFVYDLSYGFSISKTQKVVRELVDEAFCAFLLECNL